MSRRKVEGICHLCGEYGRLSFEHVPPKAAFNNRRVLIKQGMEILERLPEEVHGRVSQRGAGAETLCMRCNPNTGSWYGGAFVEWAYQGMRVLASAGQRPTLYVPFHLQPLRVIKQIFCMFFSANGPTFQEGHPELARFVLNREATGIPPQYQVYAYYNLDSRFRRVGLTASTNFSTGAIRLISEITFPPFGYVFLISSSPLPEELVDLTFMAKYGYNDWTDLSFRFPLLPVYTAYPGDYRDGDTVREHVARSRRERAAAALTASPGRGTPTP